jgi:chromosome segregation ATPase
MSDTHFWTRDEYDQHMELVVGYAAGIDRADKNHTAQSADIAKVKVDLASTNTTLTNRLNTVDAFTKELQKFDGEAWTKLTAHDNSLAALKSADTTLTNKIGAVELRVGNAEGAITGLKSADTTLGNRIGALESWRPSVDPQLTTLKNAVLTLQDTASKNNVMLSDLLIKVAALTDRVTALESASHDHSVVEPPAEPTA